MRVRFSERADKDYAGLPPYVRKAFAKQLDYLLTNLRHPSLRAKKFDATENLWQAWGGSELEILFQNRR